MRVVSGWLALFFILVSMGPATAAPRQPVEIANPTFERGPDADHPVREWLFRERVAGAACVRARETRGAVLMATSPTARGDLMCQPFSLDAWREVEVTVEVECLLGEPVVYVGLRPWMNRVLVDQDAVPLPPAGRTVRETVRLHAGLTEGEYTIQVTICGKGMVRIGSMRAWKTGFFARPEKPAFVLDVMNDTCPENHTLRWTAIDKLRTVYGFPAIHSRHYSEFETEEFQKLRPGLLLISGTSGISKGRDRMYAAIRVLCAYRAPLVGICGGHQYMAVCKGGRKIGKLKARIEGPTRLNVVRDDPIFKGLPRHPVFYARENHQYHVKGTPAGSKLLASSTNTAVEICRYEGKPWYTFQCHIERNWHQSCVDSSIIWKNLLRKFRLLD